MDGPSASPESITGIVSSGAQLVLFTTGLGNSYVSAISPTIKITANPSTAAKLREQIDYDCSGLIKGTLKESDAVEEYREPITARALPHSGDQDDDIDF